jgi:hypothetical protein
MENWDYPWALLARKAGSKSRQPTITFTPGDADGLQVITIGRIFARATGVIVFADPGGRPWLLVDIERVIRAPALAYVPHEWAEWLANAQPKGKDWPHDLGWDFMH